MSTIVSVATNGGLEGGLLYSRENKNKLKNTAREKAQLPWEGEVEISNKRSSHDNKNTKDETKKQKNMPTDRQTDRQADMQTDRQTGRKRERNTRREEKKDKQKNVLCEIEDFVEIRHFCQSCV